MLAKNTAFSSFVYFILFYSYVCLFVCLSVYLFFYMPVYTVSQQELSYRQQIARQLRTQYAEGIYRHKYYTVTLKSRLRVTQGYWKRNHWIDNRDLVVVELFVVEYYCHLEMRFRGH